MYLLLFPSMFILPRFFGLQFFVTTSVDDTKLELHIEKRLRIVIKTMNARDNRINREKS